MEWIQFFPNPYYEKKMWDFRGRRSTAKTQHISRMVVLAASNRQPWCVTNLSVQWVLVEEMEVFAKNQGTDTRKRQMSLQTHGIWLVWSLHGHKVAECPSPYNWQVDSSKDWFGSHSWSLLHHSHFMASCSWTAMIWFDVSLCRGNMPRFDVWRTRKNGCSPLRPCSGLSSCHGCPLASVFLRTCGRGLP